MSLDINGNYAYELGLATYDAPGKDGKLVAGERQVPRHLEARHRRHLVLPPRRLVGTVVARPLRRSTYAPAAGSSGASCTALRRRLRHHGHCSAPRSWFGIGRRASTYDTDCPNPIGSAPPLLRFSTASAAATALVALFTRRDAGSAPAPIHAAAWSVHMSPRPAPSDPGDRLDQRGLVRGSPASPLPWHRGALDRPRPHAALAHGTDRLPISLQRT